MLVGSVQRVCEPGCQVCNISILNSTRCPGSSCMRYKLLSTSFWWVGDGAVGGDGIVGIVVDVVGSVVDVVVADVVTTFDRSDDKSARS